MIDTPLTGKTTTVTGLYASVVVLLAEFVPDPVYGQAFAQMRFIEPTYALRVVIENTGFREYQDGTVYPDKTVVTRHSGGDLNDLSKEPMIDQITLTVLEADFGGEYPDALFNPANPSDFFDANDTPAMELKGLGAR